MYDDGLGIDKDETEAIKWYAMAAQRGHAAAQFTLGKMYEEGIGAITRPAKKRKF